MELNPLDRQRMELAPNAVRSSPHRLLFVCQCTEGRQSMGLPKNRITTVHHIKAIQKYSRWNTIWSYEKYKCDKKCQRIAKLKKPLQNWGKQTRGLGLKVKKNIYPNLLTSPRCPSLMRHSHAELPCWFSAAKMLFHALLLVQSGDRCLIEMSL